MNNTDEHKRLQAHRTRQANWKGWGPYLSERAWGTVREDYSAYGSAWDYFPHDHARSRAYRWNEDGLAGICDRNQHLCFGLALWNGNDPILKERMFGLTGPQGNHGEDVKEYYFYLDSTPTHSYMQMLYKYPHAAYPYSDLVAENGRRGYDAPEYELLDTGVFADNRYFDVFVTYAKQSENDILVQIDVVNRGAESAEITLLPTLWFRNTWSWGYPQGPMRDVAEKPQLKQIADLPNALAVEAKHAALGTYHLFAEGAADLLFTENETNNERLFSAANASPYVKDAFHRYVVAGETDAVNRAQTGTKAAAVYTRTLAPGGSTTIRLRLTDGEPEQPFADFGAQLGQRLADCEDFYAAVQVEGLSADAQNIQRQAFAGMLWSKQLYYYDVEQWLKGDPASPPPPPSRTNGRNHDWEHLVNFDVISMPDKWEYPWYATWDLAFHALPLALVDPDFAKRQLILTTREWYMHPNGQLPAYEWAFGDVNPPVHAWAAWKVYHLDKQVSGAFDRPFLEAIFHKLMLNFTWWVNRKDKDENNIFQGGFLGLDNISIFDRSAELPTGGHLDQSDGTAWMGAYCLQLMRIALELAIENPVYQDTATKLFEHFLRIASAMTVQGHGHQGLWNEEEGFFYDALHLPDGSSIPIKVRSLVGLLPLFATEVLTHNLVKKMPVFERRMNWFLENRPHLAGNMICAFDGLEQTHIAALVTPDRLRQILRVMLDEAEFLSEYGIRSVSKYHEAHPFTFEIDGRAYSVPYWSAESQSGLFGGNSNWRGPIWFPINYLIIDALNESYAYYGDDFLVECPTGSGTWMTLAQVAAELAQRLSRLFLQNEQGERPVYGAERTFQDDPQWQQYILFYEYFDGNIGRGAGASHQTGWTGLIANLLQRYGG